MANAIERTPHHDEQPKVSDNILNSNDLQIEDCRKKIISEFNTPSVDEDYDEEMIQFLEKNRLYEYDDIPDPEILLKRDNAPICTRGNISMIIGHPGARKSFLCTAIAAAYLKDGGYMNFENLKGGGKILWLDTEQARGHLKRITARINRILGRSENDHNANVFYYPLRDETPERRFKALKAALYKDHPDFVFIDGVTDLISSPNDEAESNELICRLMSLSTKYNCHILCVIHANAGSEKARGHIGSELQRKAEMSLSLSSNGMITKCIWPKTRDIKPEDFSYTIDNGLPISAEYVPDENKRENNSKIEPENYPEEWHRNILETNIKEFMSDRSIIDTLNKATKIGTSKLRDFVKYYKDKGYLVVEPGSETKTHPKHKYFENNPELPF